MPKKKKIKFNPRNAATILCAMMALELCNGQAELEAVEKGAPVDVFKAWDSYATEKKIYKKNPPMVCHLVDNKDYKKYKEEESNAMRTFLLVRVGPHMVENNWKGIKPGTLALLSNDKASMDAMVEAGAFMLEGMNWYQKTECQDKAEE